jgi:serine/threonine protein kinase/TolB-like protein
MVKPRGSRIGSYEIDALIGVGGMGEVYRARDSRLGREVAIKILPDELTSDPDRRARLDREARVLASLNHPNIAAIYGIEESADGMLGLVLELVTGSTLADRLATGALPLREALSIAGQIAAALEAAHEAQIIHRDLKPQNIGLRRDGGVKVLDFGIAKVLDPQPDAGETAVGGTRFGSVLGTSAYMSPEQMRGHEVDRRSDVWAFGCVLYEMLTGRLVFEGESPSDQVAAVLRGEPDWNLLPAGVPQSVRSLLRRCLEKDPNRRLRDIGDVRIMIEEAIQATGAAANQETSAPAPSPRRRNLLVPGALIGALALLAVAVVLLTRVPPLSPETQAATPQAGAAPAVDVVADADPAPLPRSIAVLPFDNLSPNPDDQYFAAGLHEEVLNQLAKLRSLAVISRTSVLRYGENRPGIREIARELNVGAIMEGSVRYAGDELMVTAQLIDPVTDSHLWSETFRASRANVEQIFSIQVDIATTIANALGAEITAEDRSRIDRMPTESAAAYARYLRAQEHIRHTEFAAAARELNLAIEIDPEFAEAYAQRAWLNSYGQITSAGRGQMLREDRTRDFEALTLADATRALELYPGAGVAWLARAINHQIHFRMDEAQDAFERALAAEPNNATILGEYAMFHLYRGNVPAALELARRAARFDPNGVLTLLSLAQIAAASGQGEEATAALEHAVAVAPANIQVNMLAGAFNLTGAVQYMRTADQLAQGDDAMFLQGIASGYRRAGLDAEVDQALDRWEAWARDAGVGAGDWAQYHLLRGNLDQTYEWLGRAVETLENGEADAGFFALQTSFRNAGNPVFAERRFQDLLGRLNALRLSD